MNETYNFLKEKTKVNFVATINDDKPSNRPFGDPFIFENKIYVLTNKQKDVSKQIEKNNNENYAVVRGNQMYLKFVRNAFTELFQ